MSINCFHVSVGSRGRAALHTHDNHELYYCLDGGCTQIAGSKHFDMHPGDLCLLPQGVAHFAYTQGAQGMGEWVGAWVINLQDNFFSTQLNGDKEAHAIMTGLCSRARNGHYQLPLNEAGRKLVWSAIGRMVDESVARAPGWLAVVKAQMIDLLVGLYRNWPDNNRPPVEFPKQGRHERMHAVFACIENNYMNNLMVDDLLPLAHLSRSHFHAVFTQEAGCTFKQYLNRIRVNHAQQLLQESDIPISQIALGCGFNCLSRFYAVFKEIKGMSPRCLRQSPQKPD